MQDEQDDDEQRRTKSIERCRNRARRQKRLEMIDIADELRPSPQITSAAPDTSQLSP